MAESNVTFSRQNKLSKLPLPALNETIDKYLRTIKPLVSEAAFENTVAICERFCENEGAKIQEQLEKYDKLVDSYIEEFWSDMYLTCNSPLVLNVNPIFVLEDDPTPARRSQVPRASSLILSAIKFVSSLLKECLVPDEARGRPLCMSQFKTLFGTSRQPVFDSSGKYVKDTTVTCEDSRHIVILSRGQVYVFDVLFPDGTPAVSQREITKNLDAILLDSSSLENPAERAVGVLTAENRSTWANERHQIERISQKNKRILNTIDSALFVVCLDDSATRNMNEICMNMLHGTYNVSPQDGSQRGTCVNRWYDKLQLIITSSGNAGINFEHSAVDGHTVLRFASDVFTDTIVRFAQTISGRRVHSFFTPDDCNGSYENGALGRNGDGELHLLDPDMQKTNTTPRHLEFDLNSAALSGILFAERRLSDLIQLVETECLEFGGYGKAYIVQNSMSPDAFVQVSIVAAYFLMYGRLVNTYESVQTKSYLRGRTEVARSATLEVKKFLDIWVKKRNESSSQKIKALRSALRAHSNLTKEAARGMGCDRHLMALKCVFTKQNPGTSLPDIFTDSSYEILNSSVLSTSNCGNPSLRFFGFGPVIDSGFGIGYVLKDDSINYMITSKHRQTKRFRNTLNKFLEDAQDHLLEVSHQSNTLNASSNGDSVAGNGSPNEVCSDHFGSGYSDDNDVESCLLVGRPLCL